jgi:N-acylneuraminate cytidylyltransferase
MFWPEHELSRSQDLPEAWHDAGQFYFGRRESFQRDDRIFSANSAPVPVPRHRVQDIDTPEDWVRAEALFRAGRMLS